MAKTPATTTKPRAATAASNKDKTVASTKSVATKEDVKLPAEVSASVPDFMKKDAGRGTEAVDNSEVEIPRIKLIQAISPEVEAFEDARPGQFWHTIAERALGSSLKITILMVDIRYLLWKPRWEGGGILARADDGIHWAPADKEFTVQPVKGVKKTATWKTAKTVEASGLAEWGSSNPDDSDSQPAATKMYQCLVAFDDYPELGFAVVTLQRAGAKVGKKLLGKLKIVNAPSFGMQMRMYSVQEDGQEGPYQNFAFEMLGYHTDADKYAFYDEANKRFKKEGVKVRDEEGMQDDAPGGGGGPAPEDAPSI